MELNHQIGSLTGESASIISADTPQAAGRNVMQGFSRLTVVTPTNFHRKIVSGQTMTYARQGATIDGWWRRFRLNSQKVLRWQTPI